MSGIPTYRGEQGISLIIPEWKPDVLSDVFFQPIYQSVLICMAKIMTSVQKMPAMIDDRALPRNNWFSIARTQVHHMYRMLILTDDINALSGLWRDFVRPCCCPV